MNEEELNFNLNSDELGLSLDSPIDNLEAMPSVSFTSLNPNKESKVNVASINESIFASDFIKALFEDKISDTVDDVDEEILLIAISEIEEQKVEIQNIFDNFSDKNNEENLNSLKRILHTLKGSARMVGLNKLGGLAHRIESLLDYCENHAIALTSVEKVLKEETDKIDYLLKNTSIEPSKVGWINGDKYFSAEDESLESALESEESDDGREQAGRDLDKALPSNTRVIVSSGLDKQIRVRSAMLDSLVNDAGEIRLTRSNLEEISNTYKKNSEDLKTTTLKLQQILKEVEIQAEIQIQSKKEQLQLEDKNFDPLEFDRFTRLQELIRFMAENVQDIKDNSIQTENLNKQQSDVLNQQVLLTNNILNELIKIRLVAVETVSDKLYKIVRSSAKDMNKKVILELEGENTEIDRIVLDKMFDPIAHIIRNSVAHGIEASPERISAAKPIFGKIKMSTRLEGNYIIFNVKDDGAGLDVNKIKAIGLQKNLLSPSVEYSEQELINLIFVPGFSTASSVTQLSGRGVGMDVVQTEVRALGGNIKVTTKLGQGTSFTISIPVSVATSQAMLFKSSKNLIAIPTILVNSIVSFKREQIQGFYNHGYIVNENEEIPLYYVGHLLGGPNKVSNLPELKVYNSIIIAEYNDKKIAVHVDEIINTTDILIKGVSVHLSKINGILGSTILGDGAQGLIVNPLLLVDHWASVGKSVIWKADNVLTDNSIKEVDNTPVVREKLLVLVVDDSITVRKTTEKVLINNGFDVILAKHGTDGLEQLQLITPDIILSDIEMPVMDGFDFVKNVKNNDKLKHIPIIMITSRTADKHKNYAFELGASGFIGKPFQEKELVNQIKALVIKKKIN